MRVEVLQGVLHQLTEQLYVAGARSAQPRRNVGLVGHFQRTNPAKGHKKAC